MTKYYGEIETNLGIGYIYELVKDYDGTVSRDLEYVFRNLDDSQMYNGIHKSEIINKFEALWMNQNIVVSNVELSNFCFQRISPTDFTIRIVDNIGTPVLIPLAYYFTYFAKKRAVRYWKRFLNLCK